MSGPSIFSVFPKCDSIFLLVPMILFSAQGPTKTSFLPTFLLFPDYYFLSVRKVVLYISQISNLCWSDWCMMQPFLLKGLLCCKQWCYYSICDTVIFHCVCLCVYEIWVSRNLQPTKGHILWPIKIVNFFVLGGL